MLRVIEKEDGFHDLIYTSDIPLKKNRVLLQLRGRISKNPTRTSIQIGKNKHVEDELGKYINHNCNPSCTIQNNNVITLKTIKKGDSITFDYNSSEDVIFHPFFCNCCGKQIRGRINK